MPSVPHRAKRLGLGFACRAARPLGLSLLGAVGAVIRTIANAATALPRLGLIAEIVGAGASRDAALATGAADAWGAGASIAAVSGVWSVRVTGVSDRNAAVSRSTGAGCWTIGAKTIRGVSAWCSSLNAEGLAR